MRSREIHEAWLKKLPCPVVRVDGSRAIDELINSLRAWM
jgi:hypothetical protein